MKISLSRFLKCCLTGGSLILLTSCSSREDAAKTREFQAKTEELKLETDRLAGKVAAIQQNIKAAGSEDLTGPQVVATLELKEKETQEETKRLQKIAEGLQSATQQLSKEQAAFAAKYLKP